MRSKLRVLLEMRCRGNHSGTGREAEATCWCATSVTIDSMGAEDVVCVCGELVGEGDGAM